MQFLLPEAFVHLAEANHPVDTILVSTGIYYPRRSSSRGAFGPIVSAERRAGDPVE